MKHADEPENSGELVNHIVVLLACFVDNMEQLMLLLDVSAVANTFFAKLERLFQNVYEMQYELQRQASEINDLRREMDNMKRRMYPQEAEIQAARWIEYARREVLIELKNARECPRSCQSWAEMMSTVGKCQDVKTSIHNVAHRLFGVNVHEWGQLTRTFYQKRSKAVHEICHPAEDTIDLLRYLTGSVEPIRTLLERFISSAAIHRTQHFYAPSHRLVRHSNSRADP